MVVATAPPAPGLGGVDPANYGAAGDGVTDDTVALMAADSDARAAGSFMNLGPRTYIASLTMRRGSDWRGSGLTSAAAQSSSIVAPSGLPAVRMDPSAPVYGANLERIRIVGNNGPGLLSDGGGQHDSIRYDRCSFSSYTGAGFQSIGAISGQSFVDCNFYGAPYGIDLSVPTGTGGGMDWWTFLRGQVSGDQGGLRFRATNAGGGNWILDRVRFGGGKSHTIWIHAYAKYWIWNNCIASEAQGGGVWAQSTTFVTTATGLHNVNTVTLADVSQIAVGQQLTINGGGNSGGGTFVATITALNGNVATLATVPQANFTDAECTNAFADIVHAGTTAEATAAGQPWAGEPRHWIMNNCDMGRGSGSVIRFMMSGGSHNVIVGGLTYGAPVNDPYGSNTYIGFLDPVWRSTLRPSAAEFGVGHARFDPLLNKPIWSDGTNWVDASGTAV